MRLQLALNVKDLDTAIAYYSELFGTSVHKRKPGYANFSIEDPPLKLVLFEAPDADQPLNHLGVEVSEQSEVDRAAARLSQARLNDSEQQDENCCFATQNKVWSTDPNGTRWEWYRVLEDTTSFGDDTDTPGPSQPTVR